VNLGKKKVDDTRPPRTSHTVEFIVLRKKNKNIFFFAYEKKIIEEKNILFFH